MTCGLNGGYVLELRKKKIRLTIVRACTKLNIDECIIMKGHGHGSM